MSQVSLSNCEFAQLKLELELALIKFKLEFKQFELVNELELSIICENLSRLINSNKFHVHTHTYIFISVNLYFVLCLKFIFIKLKLSSILYEFK